MDPQTKPSSRWKRVKQISKSYCVKVTAPLEGRYDKLKGPLVKRFPGWRSVSQHAILSPRHDETGADYTLRWGRLDVAASILLAFLSLAINLAFLITACLRHKPGSNGLGIFREGTCRSVNWWNQVRLLSLPLSAPFVDHRLRSPTPSLTLRVL